MSSSGSKKKVKAEEENGTFACEGKKKKKRFDNKRVGGGLVGEVMGLRVWEGAATVEKEGGMGAVREAVENCDDKSERMR